MGIYKFFDSDITGQAEFDLSGMQYQRFLQACFQYCTTVSVIVSLNCADRIASWEPYRIPVSPVVLRVYAHYGLPAEGSTDQIGACEIRHYMLTPQMKRMIQDHTTSLFRWTCAWGNDNPDDIAFYRSDGSVFFSSLIHEGECTLYLRGNEALGDILSQEHWILA